MAVASAKQVTPRNVRALVVPPREVEGVHPRPVAVAAPQVPPRPQAPEVHRPLGKPPTPPRPDDPCTRPRRVPQLKAPLFVEKEGAGRYFTIPMWFSLTLVGGLILVLGVRALAGP